MSINEESHEELIILVSAIFSMISFIMCTLATATSGWQIDSYHNRTGLFQTCYKDNCISAREKHDLPIVFAMFGQFLLVLGIISSFVNVFVYRRRMGLIIITILLLLASLFLWITVLTINLYLFTNGGSAIIFNAAIVFSLLATFTASYALGISFALRHNHIHSRLPIVPMKYNQIMMPFELY